MLFYESRFSSRYAIALCKLDHVEKKGDHSDEILKHLEKAVSIDDKDPYAFYLLGHTQYNNKDYKAAVVSFQKAEKIKVRPLFLFLLLIIILSLDSPLLTCTILGLHRRPQETKTRLSRL